MRKSKSQFLSIFIMAMVAVIIVTGLDSVWKTLQIHSNELYAMAQAADLWVSVSNPSERELWEIEQLEGIKRAEKRLRLTANTKLEGEPTLALYAAPTINTFDRPMVMEGQPTRLEGQPMRLEKYSRIKSGAVLDKDFAAAHHLRVGDRLKIEVNGYWIQYKIVGLGIHSEHVYSVDGSLSPLPDPNKHGFIVVNIDSLKDAFGGVNYYNQVELQLDGHASENSIRRQLDRILGKRLLGVQTRKDAESFAAMEAQIDQFEILALVFPIMFFVVAALITLSTMVRLVEEQRNQIGLMKALGYGKKTILWHYTSYGFSIGLLGSLLGYIAGPATIGRVLMAMMESWYVLHSYQIRIHVTNVILSSVVIILCTAGVSAYSCNQLLGEAPMGLLRAKQPKGGSHIVLERIPVLWGRMKFSYKLVARNLARNKLRFSMSVIGIMGCTALILAAFSLRQTLLAAAAHIYGEVYTYDDKFLLDGKTSQRFVNNLRIGEETQTVQQGGAYIRSANGYQKMVPMTITTVDSPLLHLPGEHGSGEIPLGGHGIIMTRKQARTMGVLKGDRIELKWSDDDYVSAVVVAVTHMRDGQGIYMTDEFYRHLGGTYAPTALLVKWGSKPKQAAQFFIDSDRVMGQTTRLKQKMDFEANLGSLTMAVILLIGFGAVLAFVVIYNMGMLNFFERVRDLSTLMVLGFYHSEIRTLVLVDNLLSSALGIVLGIPLGVTLTDLMLKDMGEALDMVTELTWGNVALAALLTLVFTMIVNTYLAKKMKAINMLEALKSVE